MTTLPKMLLIEWRDVMSADFGLFEKKDCMDIKPAHAFIIGFLVHESKDAYFVAKEFWETEQFKYLHVVPQDTAIVNVRELSLGTTHPPSSL